MKNCLKNIRAGTLFSIVVETQEVEIQCIMYVLLKVFQFSSKQLHMESNHRCCPGKRPAVLESPQRLTGEFFIFFMTVVSYDTMKIWYVKSFLVKSVWIFYLLANNTKLSSARGAHIFFLNNTFISNTRLKLAKIKQNLRGSLSLNFWWTFSKKKIVCFSEIIWLIVMKMKIIMKKLDHRNKT